MDFSFWELDSWFRNIDFAVIGSGITGLNCALRLKERFPKAKVLVLERGLLPNGASTKNAGFACFGSLSEILDDLKSHSEEEVLELVEARVIGLELLRKNLGDKKMGFQRTGGYELFSTGRAVSPKEVIAELPYVNKLLKPVIGRDLFSIKQNLLGFEKVHKDMVFNPHEGHIDTGRMMSSLLQKAQSCGIRVLNGVTVKSFSEHNLAVNIEVDGFSFKARELFIATNGFASQLGISEVKPARAQVLITEPIEDLNIKGTFHLDKGFYYFRNVQDRILLGGGRNLDLKGEETPEPGLTSVVQEHLETMLREIIIPGRKVAIEHRWSGIMGVGNQKKPIVKQISESTYCGVRLGGMGVAIGTRVGRQLADLAGK